MKKVIVVLLLVLIFQFDGFAQLQRVVIAGSQVDRIISSTNGQEYELQIFLPSGYEHSNKKYPVLYLMDSQWDFPLVTSIYGQQYYDGFIPEVIIVGVTWGGIHPNPDSLRARDYTPTTEKRIPQSGGAANFLSFLKKELIPYVETKFKANGQDRSLMGCSLGGLFTLYALFSEPELFQRYIATTPAIGWDNQIIYQYEQHYFEKKTTTPARLFMTMGEVERGLPGFEKFSRHLVGRNYKNLQIKTRVLENTGHSGNKAEGYARGLQYVFERPSLKLNAELLKKYEGHYLTSDSKPIEIKNENDKLALYVDPANKYILNAASESDFYATSEFLNIKFKKEKGDIRGFAFEHYGGTQYVNKYRSNNNMQTISTDTNIISAGAELQRLSNQFSFTEGPAVDKKGNVFFTDQPNDKIWKYGTDGKLSVFLDHTGRSNGMYFDKKGNLLTCADDKNEIWSISPDKKITVIFTEFEGKKLNGPNDLWIDKKGGIYFTDPYYQRPYWTRKAPEVAGEKVYYLAKGEKSPIIVDDQIKKPNGIVGTPDGKYLYVADIGDNKTYRYVIGQDGILKDRQLFVAQGSDGMTLDNKGNLYLTGDGVTVYNAQGTKIAHIPVPAKWTANVCFYGKERDHLFITASESVYLLKMNVRGVD